MSQFTVPVETAARPNMRRKSSAQNLLSSFKPTTSSQPAPPSAATPVVSTSIGAASMNSVYPSVATPTAGASSREWDAQSLHSDPSASGHGGVTSPALGQGASVDYLRDVIQKRIITLTYLRSVFEGKSHWFHTIMISRADLEREFNNSEMRKRTSRFTILGMSLANLLDVHQPPDLLRGLLNTLAEYEQGKEDSEKSKMRQPKRLFRPGKKRVAGGGIGEYTVSYADSAADATYVVTPHVPFQLDYLQVLITLIDIISEIYSKLSKTLSPSPFPHAGGQQMLGPLGLLSPHPGVSYLFPEGSGTDDSGSLYNIAHAGVSAGYTLGSPPPTTGAQGLADSVSKIDGKLKKIISTLLKELDQVARTGIKDELASLDPLLRNTMSFDGRTIHEYD
ncbi:hypothetical protein EV121DRAFT_257980 [Schizophyllum commune]|nr:hypothetical protein K525DRAFT_254022 [Schizophyllum commune Loenen D]